MPQASDEDRDWARKRFGSIDTTGPMEFLQKAGFVLRDDWQWQTPTAHHVPTDDESRAICFLMDEWDFGPWVRPAPDARGR